MVLLSFIVLKSGGGRGMAQDPLDLFKGSFHDIKKMPG